MRWADAGVWCVAAVLDAAVADGRAENTVRRLAGTLGTLGTLGTFAAERNYCGDRSPFGSPQQVRAAKKRAFALARGAEGYGSEPYTTAIVPGWDDVEQLATAFEAHYPGGSHVVRAMAATGPRPAELLALRVDDVDLDAGELRVHWQLARSEDWPKRVPTKWRRRRTVPFWAHAATDFAYLVEHAHDGWLIPPATTAQRRWLDSFDKLMDQARRDCGWRWRLYDLRHHFATWSLQSVEEGGYSYSLETVSRWLGHAAITTTARSYWHPTSAAVDRSRTARPPG